MKDVKNEPGSVPLRRERDERFAQILAASDGGITKVQAWCESDPAEAKPDATSGRRVSASKALKRAAERVAYIKRQNATDASTTTLTAERLSVLMASITSALVTAAKAAQAAGADNIAQQLRKSITVHAGRSERVEHRSPAPEENQDAVDVDSIVRRFYTCFCVNAI